MVSKRAAKSINTLLIIIIITALAVPLIVFSSSSGSSSGGCCGGGCCSGSEMADTQGDGTEKAEDIPTPPPPVHELTVCEQKGLSTTKVNGTFHQTNISNHFEYMYSYTITACKENLVCKITLDGLKLVSPEGAFQVPVNSSVSRSGTYSSEQVVGFEKNDVFNRMIIEVSDKSVGSCGQGKFCYPKR